MPAKPANNSPALNNGLEPSAPSDLNPRDTASDNGKTKERKNIELNEEKLGFGQKKYTSPAFDIVALTASAIKPHLKFGMPLATIQTGCVDWVLPLDKIGGAIASLVMHGEILGEYCE